MSGFKVNCSLSELNSYISSKNIELSEKDAKKINTIFNDCDTIDDKTNGEGNDGVLNDSEWDNFVKLVAKKCPKLFKTLLSFSSEKEFKESVSEINIKANDPISNRVDEEPLPKINPPVETEEVEEEAKPKIVSNVDGFNDDYDSIILKYAEENDLDPNIIKAIIKQESGFKPGKVSKSKHDSYVGLMQLSKKYVKGNTLNPEINIKKGCQLLKSMLKAFDGDIYKALVGFNKGLYGAKAIFKNPKVDPRNNEYVKVIENYYEKLTNTRF